MDTRVPETQSQKTAEEIALLPEPVIATIMDIIDAYLSGELGTQWQSIGLGTQWQSIGFLAKFYLNSVTAPFNLKLFNVIPEPRVQYCERLKINIREKNIDKLCKVVIGLGNKAHETYNNANFSPLFFLVAHMVRNMIVDHLRKNSPVGYENYINNKIKKLEETRLQEEKTEDEGDDPTNHQKQILLLEAELSYLEHGKTIKKTAIKFKDFVQPILLPPSDADNPNIVFFLQPNFAQRFFEAACSKILKFNKETLDSYIELKRANIEANKKRPQPH